MLVEHKLKISIMTTLNFVIIAKYFVKNRFSNNAKKESNMKKKVLIKVVTAMVTLFILKRISEVKDRMEYLISNAKKTTAFFVLKTSSTTSYLMKKDGVPLVLTTATAIPAFAKK